MKRKYNCLELAESPSSSMVLACSKPQSYEPVLSGVQLVGDSMLLRFSRFVARKEAINNRSSTSLSSPYDGQTNSPYCRPWPRPTRRRLMNDSIHSVTTPNHSRFETPSYSSRIETDDYLMASELNKITTETDPIIYSDRPMIDNAQNARMRFKTEEKYNLKTEPIERETIHFHAKKNLITCEQNNLSFGSNEKFPSKACTSQSSADIMSSSISQLDSSSNSLNEPFDLMERSISDSVYQPLDDTISNSSMNDSINTFEDETMNSSTNHMDKSLSTEQIGGVNLQPEYLCISGQSTYQLLLRLERLDAKVPRLKMSNKVLLMCGTNDLKKRNDIQLMEMNMRKCVGILKTFTDEVIVLTLPPIPACDTEFDYNLLQKFNTFLKTRLLGVTTIDIYPLFICEDTVGRIRRNLFEEFLGNPKNRRNDGVHWNASGMNIIHNHLCEMGVFEQTSLLNQIDKEITPQVKVKNLLHQTFIEQKVEDITTYCPTLMNHEKKDYESVDEVCAQPQEVKEVKDARLFLLNHKVQDKVSTRLTLFRQNARKEESSRPTSSNQKVGYRERVRLVLWNKKEAASESAHPTLPIPKVAENKIARLNPLVREIKDVEHLQPSLLNQEVKRNQALRRNNINEVRGRSSSSIEKVECTNSARQFSRNIKVSERESARPSSTIHKAKEEEKITTTNSLVLEIKDKKFAQPSLINQELHKIEGGSYTLINQKVQNKRSSGTQPTSLQQEVRSKGTGRPSWSNQKVIYKESARSTSLNPNVRCRGSSRSTLLNKKVVFEKSPRPSSLNLKVTEEEELESWD